MTSRRSATSSSWSGNLPVQVECHAWGSGWARWRGSPQWRSPRGRSCCSRQVPHGSRWCAGWPMTRSRGRWCASSTGLSSMRPPSPRSPRPRPWCARLLGRASEFVELPWSADVVLYGERVGRTHLAGCRHRTARLAGSVRAAALEDPPRSCSPGWWRRRRRRTPASPPGGQTTGRTTATSLSDLGSLRHR